MSVDFSDTKLPPFLYGTFDWRVHGFGFDSPPPINLRSSDALNSANPWIVLAAVLERAKSGDHSTVRLLSQFFYAKEPFALNRIALLLVGDLGRDSDLQLLLEAMASDDSQVRLYAAEASQIAGRLWLVPSMLAAWHRAYSLDEREGIGYAISKLLERELGSIADEASIFRLPKIPPEDATASLREYWAKRVADDTTDERFPDLVMDAYDQLSKKFGTSRVTVWRGMLFGVADLARDFLSRVSAGKAGDFFTYRHKFEANTGINCDDFFVDVKPQYLSIRVCLESFLESGNASGFEQGVRYFFGHRIPD